MSEQSLQIIQHRNVPVGIDPQPIDYIRSRGVNQRPVDCFAHMIEEIIALISQQFSYFGICHSLNELIVDNNLIYDKQMAEELVLFFTFVITPLPN
jgi:hypothetical protein